MEEEVVVIKRSPSDEYASKLRDLTKIGKDSHSNEKTSQGASGSATTPPPTPPTTPPPTPSTPPPPSPTAPPAPAPSAGGKMDTESDDGKYEGVNED